MESVAVNRKEALALALLLLATAHTASLDTSTSYSSSLSNNRDRVNTLLGKPRKEAAAAHHASLDASHSKHMRSWDGGRIYSKEHRQCWSALSQTNRLRVSVSAAKRRGSVVCLLACWWRHNMDHHIATRKQFLSLCVCGLSIDPSARICQQDQRKATARNRWPSRSNQIGESNPLSPSHFALLLLPFLFSAP